MGAPPGKAHSGKRGTRKSMPNRGGGHALIRSNMTREEFPSHGSLISLQLPRIGEAFASVGWKRSGSRRHLKGMPTNGCPREGERSNDATTPSSSTLGEKTANQAVVSSARMLRPPRTRIPYRHENAIRRRKSRRGVTKEGDGWDGWRRRGAIRAP